MTRKAKRWKFLPFSEDKVEQLAKSTGLHPIVCQILINRGIDSPRAVENFLEPDLKNIYDPFMLKDMYAGVERIRLAIENGEKILIFGDYDVDGITASAVLSESLEGCGGNVQVRLPNRLKEGYGLTKTAVQKACSEGIGLLITVDCGISDHRAAECARDSGLDLIITDHHHPPDKLPEAFAIINPRQKGCPYPNKDLAGVGVVLKLVQALILSSQGRRACSDHDGFWPPVLNRYLDLVCLGTIADVMPLTGENRVLAKFGLRALEQTERPGLIALKEVSGLMGKGMSTGLVGFGLAPRINATGRICRPEEAFRLICTKSYKEAKDLAMHLDLQNEKRRKIEEKILNEALNKIEQDPGFKDKTIIVLADKDWHPGVIGIVAQKLAEEFYLPAILICLQSGTGRGSARSIPQVHIYELLSRCKDFLKDFGGHAAAAGLSIDEGLIQGFTKKANQILKREYTTDDLVQEMNIDAQINKWCIDYKLIDQLNRLDPFGCGNPEPALCLKGLYLASEPQLLKDLHLKIHLKNDSLIHEAIGFNMRSTWECIASSPSDQIWDIVFWPQVNNWQGRNQIQLRLKDVKASDTY